MASKYLKIALRDGTKDGIIDVSMQDSKGLFTKCNRKNAKSYLNGIARLKGVFFLVSKNDVQIGITTELFPLIINMLLSQTWWESIYFFKDKEDTLTISELNYIKEYFIKKSIDVCTYRMADVSINLEKYNVRQTKVNYFISFIDFNIDLFNKKFLFDSEVKKNDDELINSKASNSKKLDLITKSLQITGKPKTGRELRNEAANFITNKGIKLNQFNFAKINPLGNIFWINPKLRNVESDWDLLLYNQFENKLFLFRIPANVFTYSTSLDINDKNVLLRRDDGSKNDVLEIRINCMSFIDEASGCDFSQFLKDCYDCHLSLFY